MGFAIVTGASRGIGAAIAERLAQDGHDIAITCTSNIQKAEAVAEVCRQKGVRAMALSFDVADYAACEAAVKEMKDTLGVPTILVNNAGITKDALLVRMSAQAFDDVISINLKGTFHMTKLVGGLMMRAKTGAIINLSSIVGINGNISQVNYAASKAGVIGLTKSAAKELGARGVRVNAIAPGFIESDMTDALADDVKALYLQQIPMRRYGTAEEIASIASFLASQASSYITGQVIVADGGMS